MKYTFQFGEGDKQILETRSHESQRHIVLKALGYLLFRERCPQIEVAVSENKRDYRPDVVARDAQGQITLWVDCGQIATRKVDDLTRRLPDAELVIIKATAQEMESYARECARRVARVEKALFLGFDSGFVGALIGQMGHVNTLRWRYEGARLLLTFNEREFATTLWTWDARARRVLPWERAAQEQTSPD